MTWQRAIVPAGLSCQRVVRSFLFVCLGLAQVTGCTLRGPDTMRVSRLEYNEAVQISEQRELLLNLVRLRYTDPPEFLAISSISTQMNFEAGASVGGVFGEVEESNSAFLSPGASVGYSESPTITFVPRRDSEFTRQLVAPVELDNVYLLTQYGWGIDRVLRLIASDVNGLQNVISRESPRAFQMETLKEFAEVTSSLGQLEQARLISIAVEQRQEILSAPIPADSLGPNDLLSAAEAGYRWELQENPPAYLLSRPRQHYVLRVDPAAWDTSGFSETARLLGLPEGHASYEIDPSDGVSDGAGGRIRLATRSVLGTMAYLSSAVSVPGIHESQGSTTRGGGLEASLNDLLKIHVSEGPAEGAYLSVQYRGFWFWVDDNDLASKRTLGLLTSLIRLTISAGGAQNVPILTLPVSR